jgi:hypothetical protein
VIRLKHPRSWVSWVRGRYNWRSMRSGRAWLYPASLLMLAVIVGVLLTLPPAGATDARQSGTSAASSTSGRTSAKTPPPTLNVVVVGDFYSYGYAASADRALRLAVPPTLAALNQIQLANPRVRMKVLFIPVWEATWNRLYKDSAKGKPPLINAVRDAKVVIAGVGADVPSFATSLRAIMFGIHVRATMYPPLMGLFKKGSYGREETAYLADVAARESRGGAIVTLGYPLAAQVGHGKSRTWWSGLSWHTISARQARSTNRLVTMLDADNAAATKAAGTQYQDQHLLYADPSAMPSEAGARGTQATALKRTLAANTVLPYITQAVNDELTSLGVRAAPNVSPITARTRWVLSVQLPTGIRVKVPGSGKHPRAVLRVAPLRRPVTNNQGNWHSGRRPVRIKLPVIPAPPAPLPRPIAPINPPRPVGGGGAGGGTGSGGGGGTNPGGGTGGGTSGGGTSGGGHSSPGGTTSSGGGTTSSGGGTTSPSAGGTSSGGSPSSGGTSSFGGGSSSGGGSSGGGSGS